LIYLPPEKKPSPIFAAEPSCDLAHRRLPCTMTVDDVEREYEEGAGIVR
jgi:hypothetical protein